MLTTAQESALARVFYIGAPLVTLFIIDGSVTDPVNTPKLFVLGIVAFSALGVVLSKAPKFTRMKWVTLAGLPLIFLAVSIEVLISSKAPFSQSFFGSYGRNNGFLMYALLVLILIAASFLTHEGGIKKIVYGLLTAGIINLIYCGWVLLFGDFLSWSNPYGNILGTLGNPNFIGAFLGIFGTIWFALAIAPSTHRVIKIVSFAVLPVTVVETYLSHAIQGRVLLVFGCGLVGFFWLRDRYKSNYVSIGYLSFGVIVAVLAVAGSLQS